MLAGVSATLLGVGLQRFAYAPLLPAMVQAAWLTPEAGGLAGAANFAGYLLGTAAAPAVGRRLGLRAALRAAMVLAALGLAACALRAGPAWFVSWRLVAGAAGGVLMILAGPAVQAVVPLARRVLAAGLMFMGVGAGILAGAALVPAVLPFGVAAAWAALAGAAALLTILSWPLWPDVPAPPRRAGGRLLRAAWWLVACYAATAVTATPHIVWWPDYVARGLGLGTGAGALSWLVYGVGALGGPPVLGRLADRVGLRAAFRMALAGQMLADALPLCSDALPALAASALLASSTCIGLTALTLTRARDISEGTAPAIWRISTMAWAAAQMGSGFVLAWLYAASGSHLPLFALGAAAGALALVLDRGWGSGGGSPRQTRHRISHCLRLGRVREDKTQMQRLVGPLHDLGGDPGHCGRVQHHLLADAKRVARRLTHDIERQPRPAIGQVGQRACEARAAVLKLRRQAHGVARTGPAVQFLHPGAQHTH